MPEVLDTSAGLDPKRWSALVVLLTINASLLTLTGGLAFLLPRQVPGAGVVVHLD